MTNQIPFSREIEEAVLGSILIDPSYIADLSLSLKASDFYVSQNRNVYAAMMKLYRAGMNIDALTVEQAMGEAATDDTLPHLVGLVSSVPTLHGVIEYARAVKADSIRRQLIETAGKIATDAYNTSRPIDLVIQETEQRLVELVQDRHAGGPEHIGDIAQEALADSEAAASGADLTVSTGLIDLDRMTGRLQRSDFVILAGRPGMGKTALMLQVALNAARIERRRIAIFSLEMGKKQLAHRMAAQMTGIPYSAISQGQLNDWHPYYRAIENLRGMQMHVDDTANLTPLQLRSKCRQLAASKGLDLIMVDYAQLMQADGKHANKNSESTEISRALKLLARELDVPVFVAGQLNRSVESRGEKRPALSDLRDSGAWEQDADQVWMMYREGYYKPDSKNQNVTDVIIAKNRRGETGTVSLFWNPETMGFANIDLSQEGRR